MRLPWLQVNSDGIRRAKMAGVMLGIGERAGVGFVLDLWAAALELAPEGDFSGRVPDAETLVAGVGGDPRSPPLVSAGTSAGTGGVVSILQRVGLVATHPELRVRGLDRYSSAWRKNRKSHTHPPGFPPVPAADQTRKTETETKNIKTHVSQATPSAAAEIFAHYRKAVGKPRAQLDPKRKRLIEMRLAEGHKPEDLVAAIDGYALDPWHNGENDRHKKFLDLGLMLRDSEHIERGLDLLMAARAAAPAMEHLG